VQGTASSPPSTVTNGEYTLGRMRPIPEGLFARSPTVEDSQLVTDLLCAVDVAGYGEPDSVVEDVLANWNRPGFDLFRDGILLLSERGDLAAFAEVWRSRDAEVEVHPSLLGRGIGSFLLDWVEARAAEQRTDGAESDRLGQYVVDANPTARRLLEHRGYRPARWVWRMEIELDRPPDRPVWPEGIEVRMFVPGQDDREVHAVVSAAFAEWKGDTSTYREWRAFMLDRDTFDPTLWFLATDGERIVGTSLCPNYPDMGWVRQLAVLRSHRRRGIARALLLHSFGAFRQRGRPRAGLTVDSPNDTGARELYEAVGMRTTQEIVRMERPL
jgi:mycothiol synthase